MKLPAPRRAVHGPDRLQPTNTQPLPVQDTTY